MPFIDQIKGANTTITCIVRFFVISNGNAQSLIQLSMSDIPSLSDQAINYPFLKKFPSIKESINVETKKYSISSVKLSIHNGDIGNNQVFSDLLDTDHFRINTTVQIIYYANNLINQGYLAYQGKIKYTSHDNTNVSIELEDSTQETLFKDVPVKYTPNDNTILEKSRNIPYPMVYGNVEKSPCIFMSHIDESQNYTKSPTIVIDSPDREFQTGWNSYLSSRNIGGGVASIRTSRIYIGIEGSYIELSRFSEEIDSTYELGSDYDNLMISDDTNTYINLRTSSKNDISKNSVLRGYLTRKPQNIELKSSMPQHALTQDIKQNVSFSLTTGSNPDDWGGDVINYENAWTSESVSSEVLAENLSNGYKLWLTCPPEVSSSQEADPIRAFQRLTTLRNANDDEKRHEKYEVKANYPISNIPFICSTYLMADIFIDVNTNSNLLHLNVYDPDYTLSNSSNLYRGTGVVNISVAGDSPTIHSDMDGGSWLGDGEFSAGYGSTTGRFAEDAIPFNFIQDADVNSSGWANSIIEYIYPLDLLQNYLSADGGSEPNNPIIHNQSSWSGSLGVSDSNIDGEPQVNGTNIFRFNTWDTYGNLLNPENGVSKSDTWTNVNQYDSITITLTPQIRKSIENNNAHLAYFGWDKFYIKGLVLFQNVFIDKYWDQQYYIDVVGRHSEYVQNSYDPPLEQIINDIVAIELGSPQAVQPFENIEEEAYGDSVRYSFTQSKRINSKKLIEELCSFSVLFPMFKSGKLKYKAIKSSYNPSSPDIKYIKSSDVTSYSFNRTDVRNLYSKIRFNYNYDHSLDSYKDFLNLEMHNVLAGYSYDQYQTENLEKIIDCKYISDNSTAYKVAKYMLLSNCNPHNTIKLTLPLGYINYELGDVVKFDSLIGGQKIYGENYTTSIYEINGQQKYGLFFITSIEKGQNSIKLELYQLHNLDGEEVSIVEYCPLPNYENYDSDAVEGYQGSVYYQPNPDICEGLIEEEPPPPPTILGCTNSNALNYNSEANTDNGSCFYFWNERWIGGFTTAGNAIPTFLNLSSEPDYGQVDHIQYWAEQIGDSNTYNTPFSSQELSSININIEEYQQHLRLMILLPKAFDYNETTPLENAWDQIYLYTNNSFNSDIKKISFNYSQFASLSNNLEEELISSSGNWAYTAIPDMEDSYFILAKDSDGFSRYWVLNIKIPINITGDSIPNSPYFVSGYTLEGGSNYIEPEDIGYSYKYWNHPSYNYGFFDQYEVPPAIEITYRILQGNNPFDHISVWTSSDVFGYIYYDMSIFMKEGVYLENIIPSFPTLFPSVPEGASNPVYTNKLECKFEFHSSMFGGTYSNLDFDADLAFQIAEEGLLPEDMDITSPIYLFINNPSGSIVKRRQTFYLFIGSTIESYENKFSTNPNDLNYADVILSETSLEQHIFGRGGFSMEFDEEEAEEWIPNYPFIKNIKEWKNYIQQLGITFEIKLARYSGDAINLEDVNDDDGSLDNVIEYVPFKIDLEESSDFNYTQVSLLEQETIVKHIAYEDLSNIWKGYNHKQKIRINFYNNSSSTFNDKYYIEVKRKTDLYPTPFVKYGIFKSQCDPSNSWKQVVIFNGLYRYEYRFLYGYHPIANPIQSLINTETGQEVWIPAQSNTVEYRLAHTLKQVSTFSLSDTFQEYLDVYPENPAFTDEESDCKVGYIKEGYYDYWEEEDVEVVNNFGIVCKNFKQIDEITGSANTELTYHNELYAIGNPDNEYIYNINVQDEQAVNYGEELLEQEDNDLIQTLINGGHSKSFTVNIIDNSDDLTDDQGDDN